MKKKPNTRAAARKISPQLTPRALRDGLRAGTWTQKHDLPIPPEEWSAHRRGRLDIAIRAAKLFLLHEHSYDEIQRQLRQKELLPYKVQRQRVGQYIRRGHDFFLERGVFAPVPDGERAGR